MTPPAAMDTDAITCRGVNETSPVITRDGDGMSPEDFVLRSRNEGTHANTE